jgi:D-glycero-alpha-D-manno-heptose-7-phosphate kinase
LRAVRPTEYHAKAPARLDFAGGWTDVPPFAEKEGGVVVNAAINLFAYADLTLGGDGIRFVSRDLKEQQVFGGPGFLELDGHLDLHKAALRMLPVTGSLELATSSDAPPGSGLGTSGALDTALVAVLTAAREEQLDPLDIADLAFQVETVEAGVRGGRQDQYAAALGGINRLTFSADGVQAEALALDPGFLEALDRQLVVCFTGRSRVSGDMIRRVMDRYQAGDRRVTGALHGLRETAEEMAEALRASDLPRAGKLLDRNWKHQMKLDEGMQTAEMKQAEAVARGAKALGGKAAGAGAGGCMFFLARDGGDGLRAGLTAAGLTVLPARLAAQGVSSW